MKRSNRTARINLAVAPLCKEHLVTMAETDKIPMADLIEQLVHRHWTVYFKSGDKKEPQK